ncbi:SusC/RagA family TonB-linked outer membrane protein [Alistipes sp. ZOR0009]|uniref:SusC/RagA family TonB-linked outer membrane protein n=1 Tax=Alistipes sp. ZOR0009 TaxID=1339253 RepID=UPI001E547E0E|nr:TonB-dependent receptor [Alistipes sp. ZOR0009]
MSISYYQWAGLRLVFRNQTNENLLQTAKQTIMRRFLTLLVTLLVFGVGSALGQVKQVTGVVKSSDDKQPIPGVSVFVKEAPSVGASSDPNGKYVLKNIPANAKTIVFKSVGYATVEFPIKNVLDVALQPESQKIEEVMVVAYGTSKKSSFTGSAESVKSEKLSTRPIANVTKALDGMVAGVQTTSGSGQPGSGVSIVVRGYGSITSSQSPLYVVDGAPYDGNISSINPNDIESMTILKDASSGALYGARGANGVIMINTKKGKAGKVKVNFKANWGVASRSIPRYETMDEAGYLETVFQSYKNKSIISDGLSPEAAAIAALEAMRSGSAAIFGNNEEYNPYNYSINQLIDPKTGKVRSDAKLRYHEDWLDEVMAKNPLRQEYVTSFSGGDEKTRYMFSAGYLTEEGLLKTTEFNRYNGRLNIDSDVAKWLKAGMSASYSRNESNSAPENSSANSNVWYTNQLMAPIFPVYKKDDKGQTIYDNLGSPVFDYGVNRPAGATANWNTIATLYDDMYSSSSDNLSGRIFTDIGNLNSGPLKGLTLSVSYGFDLINSASASYYNPYNGNSVAVKGSLSKANGRTFSYTFNQILKYDRKIGEHHFEALAGHEFYKYRYDYLGASKTGFPFGGLFELDAATSITAASSYQNNYAIESVLSRFGYDYGDKYYFSASFRTDGSSRFHEDNRWGNFWSVGGNWRISQESFLQGVSWLNNLAVKASYGVQGNDNVNTLYAWQSLYDLGYPNASMSGALITSLENKGLKWEKNSNLNIGVELKVFNRVSATIECYERKTTDMLMDFPMASSLGFDGYRKNIGSMRNRGLDMTIGVDVLKSNDFVWRTTLIGSVIKNKVLKLADKPEIISGNYIIKEGETLNSYYTSSAAGVDPATGKQLYWVWDIDADGNKGQKYVSDNMTKATTCREIKGSRIPDLYGSINNEFRYKGIDFSFLCTYSLGGKILDGVYSTLMYGNYVGQARSRHLERAWKQPGDVTDVPRIEIGTTQVTTDNNLIDASYFAIKNVTVGYTLPFKWLKTAGIESFRVTAAGDNIAMFTHLKGMNPQYNFTGGTNFGYVPTRNITFGIDVRF